eukprot:GHVT01030772.1.p1 GENE.GHVT01030772.1~~GHVT01030772.1.p1  ORF type:complete len:108 (-),score=23.96 GHVT01030772.1:151-474(-)
MQLQIVGPGGGSAPWAASSLPSPLAASIRPGRKGPPLHEAGDDQRHVYDQRRDHDAEDDAHFNFTPPHDSAQIACASIELHQAERNERTPAAKRLRQTVAGLGLDGL